MRDGAQCIMLRGQNLDRDSELIGDQHLDDRLV